MTRTIMVVDDDSDIILSVQEGFDDLNSEYKIMGVESGEECIKLLKNDQIPDAILLDIMMPEMSGWEVYDRLKENMDWENIPIVFLTARTDCVAVNAGNFLGADYIEKPFEITYLKNRLDLILNNIKKK